MNPFRTDNNQQKQNIFLFDLAVGVFSILLLFAFYHEEEWTSDREKSWFESEETFREIKVRTIADKFFEIFTKPTKDNYSKWKLKNFKVTGYHYLIKRSIAGKIFIASNDSLLESYVVMIPFCYYGEDLNGNNIERIRTLELKISFSKGKVVEYQFTSDRDIGISDRIFFWLKTTFIFPLIIFGVLALYFCVYTQMWLNGLYAAWRGTKFIGTINSVYATYICWDSVIITIIGAVAYILIYLLLIRLMIKLGNMAKQNSSGGYY